MPTLDAGLSQEVFDDLRLASAALPRLEAAGSPVKLWECYCLAAGERALFRRELRRLAGNGKADLSPDFLEKLRNLRHQAGPLFAKLRKLIPVGAGTPADLERQEMILGFIGMSTAARDAAARWVAEPAKHAKESSSKFRIIESIVERYRKAIEAGSVPAVAALDAVAPVAETPGSAPRPVAPTALTAHPSNSEVQLSWFGNADASEFVVKRAIAPGGPFVPIARPAAPTYTDTGLINGTTYYYTVASTHGSGESADSAPAQAAPVGPPPAPSGLEGAAANSKVTLTWKPSPGAKGYTVKRSTTPGGPYAPLAAASGPTFTDAGLVNGTTCFYAVSALNAGGESPNSAPASVMPVAPPPAPTDLAATPGHANVALVWNAVPGAPNYRVMRSTTPGGPYTAIASPVEASHLDTGVSNGTTYYYVIRAVNAGGKGPYSEEAQASPVAPPAAPAGLVAAAANSQVMLSWAASARATGYVVKRSPFAKGPFAAIASTAGTSFTDTNAVNGTTYIYAVAGTNAGGEGPASAVAEATSVAPPAAPAEVYATPGNGRITLAWAVAPRSGSYLVRRAASPAGPFATIATLAKPPFLDTNLANGTTYHYLVAASNAGGESGPSPVASAAPVAPPATPAGLAAQAGNARVLLTWSASARAASYVIRRATSPRGPFAPIGAPAATSFVDTGVTNGTAYAYVVAAVNAGGESQDSSPVEAAPLAPPAVPTGLSASPGNAQVTLTWTASTRASTYTIHRGTARGGPYVAIASSATPSFVDMGLANDTAYFYVVRAANAGGDSPDSLEESATPVAPPMAQGALAATPGNAQVALAWGVTPGATGYSLRRSLNPAGPWVVIATPSGTGFIDTRLSNGETYFYTVGALNAGGEGAPSTPAEASPVAPPPAPAPLAASPANARVALSWAAVTGATRYRVRRAPAPAGPFAEIASPTVPAYADITVTNGMTYWYAVTAINVGGESAPSAPAPASPIAPPAAPAGLSLTPGNGKITVAWTPAPRALTYTVQRAAKPGGPWETIARTAATSHEDEGLQNGQTYPYSVRATNAGGDSPDSPPAQAAPLAPPAAPSGLSAVAGNGQVALSWVSVSEALTYSIKRSDGPGLPYVSIAGPAGASYADADLENGRSYAYVVSAVNAGGEGPDSAPANVTPLSAPDAPTKLAATPGNAHVALAWSPAPGSAEYAVKRATAPGGPYANLARCSDPHCDDASVTNGATYYYVVSAMNAGGESPDSLPAEAKPVAPPAIPTGVTCTPGNTQMQLAWTAAAGAVRYVVKRAFDRRGPFLALGTVEGTSFVDKGLENGTAYFYIVTAVNAGGESHRSSRMGGLPIAPPPPPATLAATAGDGRVSLAWTASEGARRYRVRRSLDRRGPYTPVAVTAELGHEDRKVANGTTYHYIVTAFNAGGASTHSPRATATPAAPPAAPPALAATPGNGRVALLWTAVPDATAYRIFRAELPDGAMARLAEQAGTSYIDTAVLNGRRYAYAVRAANTGGESADSPRGEVVPQGPPPIPSDPTAAPGDSHVTILWKASEGAACYTVKRGSSAAGPYVPIATPTEPAYTDTALLNGTTYYYKIRSVNPSGESPDTPPLEATPTPLPGSLPSDTYSPITTTSHTTSDDNGSAAIAVLAPVRDRKEAIPVLVPGTPGALIPGIDLERLLDLRRVEQLRSIFGVTAQKIETWEVLCLLAGDAHGTRREMERLVRLKEEGDSPALHDGAVALFGNVLKVRSVSGALVRRAREYVEGLGLRGHDREALDIALGFLVSAPKGRQRAQLWIEHPDDHHRQAVVYMEHALSIAQKYQAALRQP